MNTSRHQFAFPGEITIDNLDALFAHHRRLTGGWSMDASGGGGDGAGAGAGATGAGAGAGAGSGSTNTGAGAGSGTNGAGGGARPNATDAQGNDLGYPRDTPIAEMSDKEQAAYWRHNSRKHESRFKDLVGDRDPAEVRKDLDAYQQIQREQQALNDAREEGRTEGVKSERTKAATAIFRGALEASGFEGDELDELASNFNVSAYITDDGIDTTKIANFAKRFAPAGTAEESAARRKVRDFGAGNRGEGNGKGERGSAGKAEASRRFKKNKTTADA